jgi:pyruvate kinase
MKDLPSDYRYTTIIATLGPASESKEMMAQLILAGTDIFRINMAHATGEWVLATVARLRQVSQRIGRDVAVMMDVKGPEIRTGELEHPLELTQGDQVCLVPTGSESGFLNCAQIPVSYRKLARDLHVGSLVLVASGLLKLRVLEKDNTSVLCEVLVGGTLTSRRHINLPGIEVDLPALTEKDIRDLKAGIEAGIDFVALSFVRRAADIHELKGLLSSLGSRARVIAKIEEEIGVRNMREIVGVADGIMVARGDLGIEIDYHRLPIVQRELVAACLEGGKPVIIATQLLESMIQAPFPTRAEISDVSNAVRERADAVMLSGETTVGKFPVECVKVLREIIASIQPTLETEINHRIRFNTPETKMLRSAATLSQELGDLGAGIVVFTRSGSMAGMLSALRALGVPIYAFTDVETTFRQLVLPWGVEPFLVEFSEDPNATILTALRVLQERNFCQSGDWLVVVTHVLAAGEVIETMQLRKV